MRILFDARTIRPGMTGVGRCALELLAALAGAMRNGGMNGGRLRAVILESYLEPLRNLDALKDVIWIPTRVDYQSHPAGDCWERFTLPQMVEPGEIFYGPAFLIPGGRQPFKRVAAIHDLGVFKRPRDYSRAFGFHMRWTIRNASKFADRIITPTQCVADDLVRILGIPRRSIAVVHEAPCTELDPPWPKDTRITNDPLPSPTAPFFLSVGTLETRKDPWTALAALEKLTSPQQESDMPPSWIWLGGPGRGTLGFLRDLRESEVRDRFRCMGPRRWREIAPLLAKAVALVYPSRDEGFGLPPLEAMALGVPAVVSDIPPLREVLGDAAAFFPPGDSRALAKLLRQILGDPGYRNELAAKGRAHAAQFSWPSTASNTLAAIAMPPAS